MHAIIGFILTKINVSQLIHFAKVIMLKEETAPNAIQGIISHQENVSLTLIMEDLPLHLCGRLLPRLLVVQTQAQAYLQVIHKVTQTTYKQIVIAKILQATDVLNAIKDITIIKHHKNVLSLIKDVETLLLKINVQHVMMAIH